MNAIEIRNLYKSYGDFSLSDLTLTLPSGCIMGLIGENGAGKSTTIKLLLDIVRKDSGSIRILGQDHLACGKEDIGVVMDDTSFPECLTPLQVGKIMRNIYPNWDNETYLDLLTKFSLPRKKSYHTFSRGMKMKLGIAVALSHNAKLLILDEATSGLDPVIRDEILDIFLDFTRDEAHSILISSHIVSDLEKICDYIAFLHKGQLMLCEEKDILYEQYGMIHCIAEDLRIFPRSAVLGKKTTPYGIDAIVRRDAIPEGMSVSPVNIEELFIFMVKESEK